MGAPIPVHLAVSVLGVRGVMVSDVLGLLPVLGLHILVQLGLIDPVSGLEGLGVPGVVGE